MTDAPGFDDALSMTDRAIRTVHPSHPVSGRQFALEACAYAAERAAAHAASDRFGPEHETTLGYRKVSEHYGQKAAAETRRLLDAALAG
jgi:hypothetical protein